MLANNPIPDTIDYAPDGTKCMPTQSQAEAGLMPLSAIPAQQWNALWNASNEAVRCVKYAAGVLIDEINTVLSCAGISPTAVCTNQLYTAINCIRASIGTALKAGAVKSSALPGEVSINTAGKMTANCVGNATQLNTTCKELVGAINELKTAYDTAFGNAATCAGNLSTGKADNAHASPYITYGLGDFSSFGHLRISDTFNVCQGMAYEQYLAASQYAIWASYNTIVTRVPLSNCVPQGFGTAYAGALAQASRADHVHPRNFYTVTCTSRAHVDATSVPATYCCASLYSLDSIPAWAAGILDNVYVCYSTGGSFSCFNTLRCYIAGGYMNRDFSTPMLYAHVVDGPNRVYPNKEWSVCVSGFTQQAYICSTYSCYCDPRASHYVNGLTTIGEWYICDTYIYASGRIGGTFIREPGALGHGYPPGYIIL